MQNNTESVVALAPITLPHKALGPVSLGQAPRFLRFLRGKAALVGSVHVPSPFEPQAGKRASTSSRAPSVPSMSHSSRLIGRPAFILSPETNSMATPSSAAEPPKHGVLNRLDVCSRTELGPQGPPPEGGQGVQSLQAEEEQVRRAVPLHILQK